MYGKNMAIINNWSLVTWGYMYVFAVLLHAVKKRKQSTAEVEGLQWDGGEHFCVSASRQMDQDPFSLMMVCLYLHQLNHLEEV